MIHTIKYTLTIGWLYPELMSTYGDRGNIICITKRGEWCGISIIVKRLDIGYSPKQLKSCDLLFMGGAQDTQQAIVARDLREKKNHLSQMIEDNTPGLYICGAYQFLGKYYKEANGTLIHGLGLFDLHTEHPGEHAERLIGNIWVESDLKYLNFKMQTLVGFENHGGRTYLGKTLKPLGTVKIGFGNNGIDKTEGAMYKNSFGTYLHGPILPKNPHFADALIKLALEKKYGGKINLEALDDSLEFQAHEAIVKKLAKR